MSNNVANPDAPNLPYYVAMYQGRSVGVKRDADYQNTIKLVQKSIARLRSVDPQDILIFTALTDYGGAAVQISEEIWPDVVGDVRIVEISLDDPADASHPVSPMGRADDADENLVPAQPGERVATVAAAADPTTEHTPSRASPRQAVQDPTNALNDPSETFSITVRTASQNLLELGDLRSSSTIGDVKSLIETAYNVPAVLQRLDLFDQPLDNTNTLDQYHITDWTILDLHLNARQYLIYIYPDRSGQTTERSRLKDVEIHLSLNRAWELATLRPSRTAPLKDYVQSVSWTLGVAGRVFWDGISKSVQAETSVSPLLQTQLCAPHSRDSFSSLVPLLDPKNSAAIPFDEVACSIERNFYNIGFTDDWLSPTHFVSQLRRTHEYIALRFVFQADCETIASLAISPPTDHITRVLVLYKGLSAAAARIWNMSSASYLEFPKPLKDRVGTSLSEDYWTSHPGIKVFEVSWMEVC